MADRVRWRDERWDGYRSYNARFAREIAETATPGDLVWVHDYHLLLVSQMLARERPVLVVGLSIHTPIEAMVLAGLPIAAGLDDAPTVRL